MDERVRGSEKAGEAAEVRHAHPIANQHENTLHDVIINLESELFKLIIDQFTRCRHLVEHGRCNTHGISGHRSRCFGSGMW